MGSVVRVAIRGVLKFVVLHPLPSMAVVVMLGVGLLLGTNSVPEPFRATASTSNNAMAAAVTAKGNIPAPIATEDFMSGQATFNAEKIWNSLSEEMHTSLASQGSDISAIQTQLDQYKEEGRQFEDFIYIGGFAPTAQKAFYFYVASIRQPELGGKADQVFFAFTVDSSGKIAKVE